MTSNTTPSGVAEQADLPPLPKPAVRAWADISEHFLRADHYSAEQMCAYARASQALSHSANVGSGPAAFRLAEEAIDAIEDWAGYADDYFKKKHCYDEEIAGFRARLASMRVAAEASSNGKHIFWSPQGEQFCIHPEGGKPMFRGWQRLYTEAQALALAASQAASHSAPEPVAREDFEKMSGDLTRAKNLLVRLWDKHPDARAQIEASTGPWFVWGQDRDAQAPAAHSVGVRFLTQAELDSIGSQAEGMDGQQWDIWVQEKFAEVNSLKLHGSFR